MTMKSKSPIKNRTGPVPERLKLTGDWENLIGKALAKPRPASGWPVAKAKKKAGNK